MPHPIINFRHVLQTLPELVTPLKLRREEELVLFIAAQLSTDAVGALQQVYTSELNHTHHTDVRAQELCESRGGRRGLPVPNKPTVSVDEKQHSTIKLT